MAGNLKAFGWWIYPTKTTPGCVLEDGQCQLLKRGAAWPFYRAKT